MVNSHLPITLSPHLSFLSAKIGRLEQRGYLALTLFLWGAQLIVVGKCVLTFAPSAPDHNTSSGSSNNNNENDDGQGFTFSKAMVGAVKYLDALGVGSEALFLPSGLLWMLASLVFLDGWPALAFALALCGGVVVKLVQTGSSWAYLVFISALAVSISAAVVDVGTGIVWNGYGAAAVVSALTLPLPWVVKAAASLMSSSSSSLIQMNVDDETKSAAWQLSSLVACVLTIPFGFAASMATRGSFAPLSVAAVCMWCVAHPSLHSLGAALLPNFALVSGLLLRHGGESKALVGGMVGDAIPGIVMTVCGFTFAGAGRYFNSQVKQRRKIKKQKLSIFV